MLWTKILIYGLPFLLLGAVLLWTYDAGREAEQFDQLKSNFEIQRRMDDAGNSAGPAVERLRDGIF